MGAANVKAVFVHWGDLPGGPFRLLAYMALRTRDTDGRPQYWGGREDLAFGLGRRIPDDDGTDASRSEREKAFKAVKLAVGALLKAGAIRTVERAKPGRNAVYEINLTPHRETLEPPAAPVDNPATGPGNRAPSPVDTPPTGPEDRAPYGSRKTGGMGPVFRAEWVPENGGMGPGNRAPEEEKDESGLSEGGGGEGFPASAPPSTAPAAKNDQHPSGTGKTWTYRAACEYLMTRSGAERDDAERLAAAELGPAAKREAVLTRAAAIAHAIATGVPA